MERESTLGRVLWIALLVALGGYVILDFARSPIFSESGSAAIRPTEVTIWSPSRESDGESGEILRGAATSLELQGHPTAVKRLHGGTSAAVAGFLARRQRQGTELLAVTSSTLADIAHDRRERLVPGAAEEAALAAAALRGATPVGLLASDPLTLAVAAGSPLADAPELIESMRADPWGTLVAIPEDTWSRVQLAALVSRADVDGNVRFSIFRAGEAGRATGAGPATFALATRTSLADGVGRGRLRELTWPFADSRPRFWAALVAPAGLSPERIARLRGWIAELQRDPEWRQALRHARVQPAEPGATGLAGLLRDGLADAHRLESLSRRIEGR